MKMKNSGIGKDEVTIISAGVLIEGKITTNGNIRIDGNINGDVLADGNITVGETGEINGEITGEMVNIGGSVNGAVNAREKLTLEGKSHLKGDLVTKILVIEAGASFEGRSSMSGTRTAELNFDAK